MTTIEEVRAEFPKLLRLVHGLAVLVQDHGVMTGERRRRLLAIIHGVEDLLVDYEDLADDEADDDA